MKKQILFAIAMTITLITTARAENVEVALQHNLDGYLNKYCLDIKGGGPDINPANGLQVHTCYSYRGGLEKDQIFETTKFTNNQFYMPKFDVCAEVTSLEAGANVVLSECNQNKLQNITLSEDGTIRPVEQKQLCFTASLTTKQGRNGTSDHQIKALTLEKCSDNRAIFQQWYTRTEAD